MTERIDFSPYINPGRRLRDIPRYYTRQQPCTAAYCRHCRPETAPNYYHADGGFLASLDDE